MRVLLMCVCGLLGLQMAGCQVASSGGPGMNMLPDSGPGADGSRPDVSLPDGSLPPQVGELLHVDSVSVRYVLNGQVHTDTVPRSAITRTAAGILIDRSAAVPPYQITITGASFAGLDTIDAIAYTYAIQAALRGNPLTLTAGSDGRLEGNIRLVSGSIDLTSGVITASSTSPDVDGDGIPNTSDPDIDGDGAINASDPDMDGDGLLNAADGDPRGLGHPGSWDIDGDGLLNDEDNNDDGDGHIDPCDPTPQSDQAAHGGSALDYDGDGLFNQNCHPSLEDLDDDNDGIPDGEDFVLDPPWDLDRDGTANIGDPDDDNDGIPDASDPTPYPFSPDRGYSTDNDNDGVENIDDSDDDNDGVPDTQDPTPSFHNRDFDIDLDGTPNHLDSDADGDGVPNDQDPTPWGRLDADRDGIPDGEDSDDDGDGVPDDQDTDDDGDGTPDAQDTQTDNDYDGDGIPNSSDPDDDNDGLLDTADIAPHRPAGYFVDTDGDGIPDYLDLDRDGDGVPDSLDQDGQPMLDDGYDGQPNNQSTNDLSPFGQVFSGTIFHDETAGLFADMDGQPGRDGQLELVFDFIADDTPLN